MEESKRVLKLFEKQKDGIPDICFLPNYPNKDVMVLKTALRELGYSFRVVGSYEYIKNAGEWFRMWVDKIIIERNEK
mgnify:CR=1 FL=1